MSGEKILPNYLQTFQLILLHFFTDHDPIK